MNDISADWSTKGSCLLDFVILTEGEMGAFLYFPDIVTDYDLESEAIVPQEGAAWKKRIGH
ncbi:hypothetical protein ACWGNU_03400 [Paenibacillus lautus]|nr:hypothetical protein [Cytobacillus firmus]GIP03600.1 hypothetical protein J28TS4_20070 [Paenibacillus lautus]